MFPEYLQSRRLEGRYSPGTLFIMESWLKQFERFCAGRDPAKLKSSELNSWRQELVWRTGPDGVLYSGHTINQAVWVVRGFYRWAEACGYLSKDPSTVLKMRGVPRREKRKWTPTEVRSLLSCPDLDHPLGIRDRAVLGILLETDITRPACSRLDLEHLQLDTGALFATGRKRGVKALSDGLCADIERYLKESRPILVVDDTQRALFLNQKGGRFSLGSIQRLFALSLKACGLKAPFSSS